VGPWVDELRLCWRAGRERAPLARAVVDLKDVTLIDDAGKALLAEILSAGTDCIATGVANRHLLQSLKNHYKSKPRRLLEDLCERCEEPQRCQDGDHSQIGKEA